MTLNYPGGEAMIYPHSESFVTKGTTVQAVPDIFDKKWRSALFKVNIEITPEAVKIIEKDT